MYGRVTAHCAPKRNISSMRCPDRCCNRTRRAIGSEQQWHLVAPPPPPRVPGSYFLKALETEWHCQHSAIEVAFSNLCRDTSIWSLMTEAPLSEVSYNRQCRPSHWRRAAEEKRARRRMQFQARAHCVHPIRSELFATCSTYPTADDRNFCIRRVPNARPLKLAPSSCAAIGRTRHEIPRRPRKFFRVQLILEWCGKLDIS